MSTIPTPTTAAGAIPPTSMVKCSAVCVSQQPLTPDVSAVRHDPDEHEARIRKLGRQAEEAYAAGDKTGARIYAARMVAAIKARSPAVRAAMEAQIQRDIDNGGVAYFDHQGLLAAELLAQKPKD
jgi:hypothetical protein